MEKIKDEHSNDNHDTLEYNEQSLVFNQRPIPSFAKLHDTEDGADEDTDGREGERDEKSAEFGTSSKICMRGIERRFTYSVHSHNSPHGEVGAEKHENQEGEDLKSETCHHDVVAGFRVFVRVRGR